MKIKEFRCHTLGLLCDMLEASEDLAKRRYDRPAARIETRMVNLNRDPDKQPDPYTIEEVAPYLFPVRPIDEIIAERAERMANKAEVMVLNMNRSDPSDPSERKGKDTRKKKPS